jgi:hypothetical protein
MSDKLTVEKTESKLIVKIDPNFKPGNGLVNFASWNRLLPYIENAGGKRINEELIGLSVNEEGIYIYFRSK